jgi:hypothetical protein
MVRASPSAPSSDDCGLRTLPKHAARLWPACLSAPAAGLMLGAFVASPGFAHHVSKHVSGKAGDHFGEPSTTVARLIGGSFW